MGSKLGGRGGHAHTHKTLDLETGQWLFVSYKATKRRGVPVFIQAPDNEAVLAKALG